MGRPLRTFQYDPGNDIRKLAVGRDNTTISAMRLGNGGRPVCHRSHRKGIC